MNAALRLALLIAPGILLVAGGLAVGLLWLEVAWVSVLAVVAGFAGGFGLGTAVNIWRSPA